MTLTKVQEALLRWYDAGDRDLPWRGERDPYKIWVSEIMLQQTRAEAVKPYYARFLAAFPDVQSLASAPLDQVYKLWEGLGYYSRARNLHRAAEEIVTNYDGKMPATAQGLQALPGIGPYASGAIASIAYGEPVPALDGNQMRVLARLCALRRPLKSPMELADLARQMMPAQRPGDYNQALMDLGATVCLPRNPRCEVCPLAEDCAAHREGIERQLPVKAPKKEKQVERRGVALVFWKGRVLVRRRPDRGLLAGLYEFPNYLDACDVPSLMECLAEAGVCAVGGERVGDHEHVFTHKIWRMEAFRFCAKKVEGELEWADSADLERLCFPSALRPFWVFAREELEKR